MKRQEIVEKNELHYEQISKNLNKFNELTEEQKFKEFIFCMLTPQSNAKKCWDAVERLFEINKWDKDNIVEILKTRTRFHNNKSKYVLQARNKWGEVKKQLDTPDKTELRNHIANTVDGYGLKEASHFLRNIGESKNQIAILDRHILRNLVDLGLIKEDKIKSKKDYINIEKSFLEFSNEIGIPIDNLDLIFWFNEHGEFFK
jgi:N-glycosylase/DNA lyase